MTNRIVATRTEEDGETTTIGPFHTIEDTKTAINSLLAQEWGSMDMALEDEPQEGGFWVDSADNTWEIEQA